jgi:hypothetical protein
VPAEFASPSLCRKVWGKNRCDEFLPSTGVRPLAAPQAAIDFPLGLVRIGCVLRSPLATEAGRRRWQADAIEDGSILNCPEVDKGSHFAGWKQPDRFTDKIRAAFRSLP